MAGLYAKLRNREASRGLLAWIIPDCVHGPRMQAQQKELDIEKARVAALEELDIEKARVAALEEALQAQTEKNAESLKKNVAAKFQSAVAQSKEEKQEAAWQQKQQELEEELRKEKQQKLEQEAALQQKQQELEEELRKQHQKLDQVEECKAKALKATDDLAKQMQKMQQEKTGTDSAMPVAFRDANFKEVAAKLQNLRQQQAANCDRTVCN